MSKFERISLSKLFFDPENPRMPQKLQNEKNESKIVDYMIRFGNIVELMQSIGESNYSDAEPLLVVPKSENSDEYFVVEGNRRLAALKLLSDPSMAKLRKGTIQETVDEAKYKPTSIPSILYVNRSEILDYLGYRHITGVKDWGPLAKARYLNQLYNSHLSNIGPDRIYYALAKMIGSNSSYVSRLHISLKLYDKANDNAYFGADISEEDFDFSWLPTMLSYSETIQYLNLRKDGKLSTDNLNLEHFKNVFIWMFDPKNRVVSESRQLRQLNQILSSSTALEKLDRGSSLAEAILFTQEPVNVFMELLEKAKGVLQSAKDMIEQLSQMPDNSSDRLDDIEKLSRSIKGALQANFAISSDPTITPELFEKFMQMMKKGDKDGTKK